jgi:hypothetical protein
MNIRKAQKQDISEKWFPRFERLFGYKNNIKMVDYGFQQPWYQIYRPYIGKLLVTLVVEMAIWVFFSYGPILITDIVKTRSLDGIYRFSGIFLVVYVVGYWSLYSYCKAVAGVKYSIANSAYKYFLLVDPLNHATRSSGQVISKIDRATASVETLTDIVSFELTPFCVQIAVITFSMMSYNTQAGLFAGLSLCGLVMLSTIFQYFVVKIVVPPEIKQEDVQKQLNVESLAQVAHIRSSFATVEQVERLKSTSTRTAEVEATNWISFISSHSLPRIAFIVCFWFMLHMVFNLISQGVVDMLTGSALLVMYFTSYGYIVNAGRKIEKLVSNIDKIKDLFTFIRGYGEQTYPVLPQK